MLRSLQQLYGHKLGASDGEIGHVKDFYFDDQNWAVRYVIADTGTWLTGRQVLLAPHSLGLLDQPEKILRVNLTRKQIEDSPSIETRKPVSRQYEEEYYRYFGWPSYWQGDALEAPPTLISPQLGPADTHLRSTQAVKGYHFQTAEGNIGHVCDFMIDANSWKLGQLVVKTGHRLSGREVFVPVKNVDRISYEDSTVFATWAGETGEAGPLPQKLPAGQAV